MNLIRQNNENMNPFRNNAFYAENLHQEDLWKTAILAGIGDFLNFLIKLAMKAILKYFKK